MYKPRQGRFSSIPWDLRNEARVLTKAVLNSLIIAPGTIKSEGESLNWTTFPSRNTWEGGQLTADSALAQFLIKRGAGFSSSLAVALPRLSFPGLRKKNLGETYPGLLPWALHKEQEQREGAVVPNSITPKSSPLFFQPQYSMNRLKSRWLPFFCSFSFRSILKT